MHLVFGILGRNAEHVEWLDNVVIRRFAQRSRQDELGRRTGRAAATRVADGARATDVSERVRFERKLVRDARVGGIPLILVMDRFERLRREDGVWIVSLRLQLLRGIARGRDAVRNLRPRRAVLAVELLPQ